MTEIKLNNKKYGKIYTHRIPTMIDNVIEKWNKRKIKVILCLLEERVYNIIYEGKVQYKCMQIKNFPIADWYVPTDMNRTKELIDYLIDVIKDGKNIAIHCHGGHGRTGTIVAILYSILNGVNAENSLKKIREIKDKYVERKVQEDFVKEFLNKYEKGII